jgi:hypothetical protein
LQSISLKLQEYSVYHSNIVSLDCE